MEKDEHAPKTVLYPRDPSLDPQLVWKGKEEQDSQPLEVPAVPIYIQEKIHPQASVGKKLNKRFCDQRSHCAINPWRRCVASSASRRFWRRSKGFANWGWNHH